MGIVRTLVLFVIAAVAEIGGAWLIWQGIREHRGLAWVGAGIAALAAYGFVATLQEDAELLVRLDRAIEATNVIQVSDALVTTVAQFRFACRTIGHPLANPVHH